MKQKMLILWSAIVGLVSTLFLPLVAWASTSTPKKGLGAALSNVTGIGKASEMSNDIPTIIGTIVKGAISLIGLIFFLLMVYAGYLWMTARGESEPVDKARSIFMQSVIGLIIVVSAYAITFFITRKVGG